MLSAMDEDQHSDDLSEYEAAACTGKERFSTYSAAKRVADRPRIKNPIHLAVYKCRYCGAYHLAPNQAKKKKSYGPRKKRTIRF